MAEVTASATARAKLRAIAAVMGAASFVLASAAPAQQLPKQTEAAMMSDVRATENAVLFRSVASLEPDGSWRVPVHAWVYVPARSRVRKAGAEVLLNALFGVKVKTDDQARFSERIDLLFADNKGGRRLSIEIAGTRNALPPTQDNGHTTKDILISAADAKRHAAADGTLGLQLVLDPRDPRRVETSVRLAAGTGLSIISDIDDTVKVSEVTDKGRLMARTFLEPYEPVVGMANLIRRIAGQAGHVHYVSSSPWHLYEPLLEFMAAADLPAHELQLKYMRIKDETVFDIAKSPTETKPALIEAILKRFPKTRFVMIGDSGEKDPEIYAGIAGKFPNRIASILIREATPGGMPEARRRSAFAGLPAGMWQVFTDPATIALPAP